MDFFDLSPQGDGTHIDYSAFARLCRYRGPEGLSQVQRLVRTRPTLAFSYSISSSFSYSVSYSLSYPIYVTFSYPSRYVSHPSYSHIYCRSNLIITHFSLRFFSFLSFSVLFCSVLQKKMVLGPDSMSVMRRYDPQGSGYIRRPDMLRALAELGELLLQSALLSSFSPCPFSPLRPFLLSPFLLNHSSSLVFSPIFLLISSHLFLSSCRFFSPFLFSPFLVFSLTQVTLRLPSQPC